MEIKRDKYLNDLVIRMHNGMIKVVTGMRRCGKSYLLFRIFRQYLREQGIADSHVVSIALDDRRNRSYRDPDVLLDYIESLIEDSGTYYILLDEVQMLTDFEEVLNSLLHISNLDIYVTGSNSRFLSKDVITEFRGRGDEVHVYPLTFREFMQVYDGDRYQGLEEYMVYGGLPLAATMRTEEQKNVYLSNLFRETYLKDILERYQLERIQEMEDLIRILASSIGSMTNVPKIEATFRSVVHSNISANTIRQYIGYLEDAFIISKADRYNVKGRKYIGSPMKYYFEDTGLRNALLGFRQVEETHLMENVLYNELRARGFTVDVGIVGIREQAEGQSRRKQLEIDFVANQGSRRYYIQSALHMPTEEKAKQEKNPLVRSGDSFKKIIVVHDVVHLARDEDGITTMSIYDFLLDENSLEL